jgi:4-diphosphocytidyl-2-C-methyl-D-erythritol kinase
MAGGSTDAAAAFLALNDLWGLGLGKDELCRLAVSLGADIPYCIVGGTALSEGIGEVLTTIEDVPDCYLVIAKPDIDVSTGWVYTELDSREIREHPDIDGIRASIEKGDLRGMCSLIGNVLEPVTVSKYPVITQIERILEDNGAIRAFMTGSGPTVYAVYETKERAEQGLRAVEESALAPELFLSRPVNPNK